MVNANNLWYRNKAVSYRSEFVYNSPKNSSAAHNVYCGDKSSLKVVLLFLDFFLFAFVIFSHSSSAKSLSAYAWISVMKFASRDRQLSSTSRSKSKASESLLVFKLESLVSYLRSVKILTLLKIVR